MVGKQEVAQWALLRRHGFARSKKSRKLNRRRLQLGLKQIFVTSGAQNTYFNAFKPILVNVVLSSQSHIAVPATTNSETAHTE
jgi:hypothetical protein